MKSQTKQTLKIFWQHSRAYGWRPYVLFFGMILVTILRDTTPLLYRNLINFLIAHKMGDNLEPAVKLVILILCINFIRVTIWRAINFVNNYFQSGVMADLTRTCYEYLHKHSIGYFNSNFVGSLVTKVKRYERSFEQLSDQFIGNIGRAFVETGIIVAILLLRYWPLGLAALLWTLTYIIYTYFYALYKLKYDIKRAAADTLTTAQLADTITNNFNIKIFSSYTREFKRFANVVRDQYLARKKSWDLGTIGELFQGYFMIFAEFGIMLYVLALWARGILTIGDIVLVQAYLGRIFDQLWDTGRNIRTIYEALADADEMTAILMDPHQIKDLPGARNLKVPEGRIEMKDITFSYDGNDREEDKVLKNFDLVIAPGERIALVGQSGGGKSTIAKLLLRFYDIQQGHIFIDGSDIAKCTQDSLRDNISFVPQEPVLFHRSLMENIRYSKPNASDTEVVRAARLAHCHEFISSFPEGYETLVGERGIKLSGGERQRVAIARAMLKNSPILILDEATSSLDSESESYIQDSLKTLMKGKTTIVVAHRLSTIMQMDRIIVIDGGHIVEQGKHTELIKAKKGLYQKLWQIQAGGFA